MNSPENQIPLGHEARILTEDEIFKLKNDKTVSNFKQVKLEEEAQKNWDKFYNRNSNHFFKDRHWTIREFKELCGNMDENILEKNQSLLEVGCGVGNLIFPLLEENPHLTVYACDFSSRAIDFVKNHPLYSTGRCTAFICDITKCSLSDTISANSIDLVTLVFVLSAVHPDKMPIVLNNIYKVVKPGGAVLFRDYGLYDEAMLRFAPGHKLQDSFYVRQDGTRAFYFSTEILGKLFSDAKFEIETNSYIQRKTVNKKKSISVPRIFVQGKFIKSEVISSR